MRRAVTTARCVAVLQRPSCTPRALLLLCPACTHSSADRHLSASASLAHCRARRAARARPPLAAALAARPAMTAT